MMFRCSLRLSIFFLISCHVLETCWSHSIKQSSLHYSHNLLHRDRPFVSGKFTAALLLIQTLLLLFHINISFCSTIVALSHLVMSCNQQLYNKLIEFLLEGLTNDASPSTTRTYIQCIAAIWYIDNTIYMSYYCPLCFPFHENTYLSNPTIFFQCSIMFHRSIMYAILQSL